MIIKGWWLTMNLKTVNGEYLPLSYLTEKVIWLKSYQRNIVVWEHLWKEYEGWVIGLQTDWDCEEQSKCQKGMKHELMRFLESIIFTCIMRYAVRCKKCNKWSHKHARDKQLRKPTTSGGKYFYILLLRIFNLLFILINNWFFI